MWRYFKDKADEFQRKLFRPIPPDFHSFETGEPFARCIECARDLSYEAAGHLIEKYYQNDEVILEYALCDKCAKGLRGELSKESRKHIKKALRRPALRSTIVGCRVCSLPREELMNYTIVGSCLGDRMLFWNVPLLICEPCLETIAEGLSAKTKGTLDDFQERNFPGPPAGEVDLPKPKRKIVLV